MLILGNVVAVRVVDVGCFGQLSAGEELLTEGIEIHSKLGGFTCKTEGCVRRAGEEEGC